MFPTACLTAFLALVVAAAASPLVRVDRPLVSHKLVKNLNPNVRVVDADRARIANLLARGSRTNSAEAAAVTVGSAPVTNVAVTYLAEVTVGNQIFDLIVDTGSSNTWVGAGTKYKASSTSKSTGDKVSVTYGSGSFSGTEFTDTVTLDTLTVTAQSIGVATEASGFDGVDGILGIGPEDLTEDTISGVSEVPTFTQNLHTQGVIPEIIVAVSFEPTTSESVTNGELTFGGVDTAKFTGDITYTSLTTTAPASDYWGINQEVLYNTEVIQSTTAGIVDTGTTLLYLATGAYNDYVKATGATLDNETGLLKITAAQFAALEPVFFEIGGTKFELTPDAQLWPRALNTFIGGTSSSYYLIINDLGTPAGEGFDFVNGQVFLERFYSVFDTTNSRFGLATTAFTSATTNN